MSVMEYVSVFAGIIVSLAAADLLIAIAVAMRFRPHLWLHYAAILGFMSYITYRNSVAVIGG